MEKLLTEALLVVGLFLGSGWGINLLHDAVRAELISALIKPSPSLSSYTAKLTRPR